MSKIVHPTPPGFTRKQDGTRIVYAPGVIAKATHARFREQVREFPLVFKDPLIDVRRHRDFGHRFYFKTDLKSAFDQVTFERLRTALKARGINPAWLSPRKYFFHENGHGGLIQGAPVSPYLFETYCRYGGLDYELAEYCETLGYCYSRYVDDLLISAPRKLGKRIGPMVRGKAGKYGFELSDKKTKRVDSCTEPLEVLGYVVRNGKIDAHPETLQALYDPSISEEARKGLLAWRRHVRRVGKRRVVHRRVGR